MYIAYAVTLLPSSSSTETETDESGPCSSLEEKNGEDDTKGGTKSRADEEGAEAGIPLFREKLLAWLVLGWTERYVG